MEADEFNKETAETTIYINGNIYTVDAESSVVQALVIKKGRILYAGNNETAKKFGYSGCKVIDLEGNTVIPGIIEAHLHMAWLGNSLLEINATGKTKEDILDMVADRVKKTPKGQWVIGRCWTNTIWDDTSFPCKEDLDAVAPEHPVCLHRMDCHTIWVNSLALKIGNVDRNTPDCVGGQIYRDANGDVTGILSDHARDSILAAIPPYTDQEIAQALLAAQKHLIAQGITSVGDLSTTLQELKIMKELLKNKNLKLRLYLFAKEGETAKECYRNGIEIGSFDDHLTLRGVKLFADGSVGARGACLLEDYADQPGHRGTPCYTDEEFYELVREARVNGFQVSTHVNADGSVSQALKAYTRVLDELPLKNNRYRLEHFQIVNPELINITATYGFIPCMQAVACASDRLMAEERLGKGTSRLAMSYAWRSTLNAGLHIANSTDAPCDDVNPFYNFYVAVTRCNMNGEPEGGWYPEQRMTREEALKAATIWAAEAQFEENLKGSLESGKLADFTVIDRDIMMCPLEEIKRAKSLKTVIGGEVVYESK